MSDLSRGWLTIKSGKGLPGITVAHCPVWEKEVLESSRIAEITATNCQMRWGRGMGSSSYLQTDGYGDTRIHLRPTTLKRVLWGKHGAYFSRLVAKELSHEM